MSLRNEIRPAVFTPIMAPNAEPTTWLSWYDNIKQGARAIHLHNPDVLIFLSGQRGDQDLSKVANGEPLDPSPRSFDFDDFDGFADKLVLELHSYDNIDLPAVLGGVRPGKHDCAKLQESLYNAGFSTLTANATNRFPLVLSEFGWGQDDFNTTYATCLLDYIRQQQVSWMIWHIGGSYYTRQGRQDADDSWGLLNHDWSAFRSPEFIDEHLRPLADWTLAANNLSITTKDTLLHGSNYHSMGDSESSILSKLGQSSLILVIMFFLAATVVTLLIPQRCRPQLARWVTQARVSSQRAVTECLGRQKAVSQRAQNDSYQMEQLSLVHNQEIHD